MKSEKILELLKESRPQDNQHSLWGRFQEMENERKQSKWVKSVMAWTVSGLSLAVLAFTVIWKSQSLPIQTAQNGVSSVAYSEKYKNAAVESTADLNEGLDYYYTMALEI